MLRRGKLDETMAHKLGPEAVTLAMLATSKHIAEQDADLARLKGRGGNAPSSPSTPSGTKCL